MTTATSSPTPGPAVRRTTFVSDDAALITAHIGAVYAEVRPVFARVRDGAGLRARHLDVPALGVDRVRAGLGLTGLFPTGFVDLVVYQLHAGGVRTSGPGGSVDAAAGGVVLVPLGVPVEVCTPGYDVTVVRLPGATARRVAEEVTGVPGDRLRFHATRPVSPAMLRYWRGVSALASGALADPASPMASPLLAEDLARTVATAALRVFPSTVTTRAHGPGPGDVAPATVRRAVAHLEAHAYEPVTLTEVAAAARTSPRALQHGFRQHLGTTPLGYLRRVRLERARRELQAADPATGVTVAAVAARWGFATPSAFAAAYRAVHGETPSTTLRT